MKKKLISLVVATGMITGIGVVGATGAQAETRSTGSTTFTSPIAAKPNFVPPTDGGSSSPTPGASNPEGRQVCSVVQYVSDYVGFWQKVSNVFKWVQVAIYSSALVCSVIYN